MFSVLGCLAGLGLGGLPGLILGVAVGSLAGCVSLTLSVMRHGLRVGLQDLRYTLVAGACGILGAWAPERLVAWTGVQDVALAGVFFAYGILAPFGLFLLQRARHMLGAGASTGSPA